jgi:hypothetical protein
MTEKHAKEHVNKEVSELIKECAHYWQGKEPLPPLHRLQGRSRVVGCYGNGRGKGDNKALWSEAMGIDWMVRKEMSQASGLNAGSKRITNEGVSLD